VTIAPSANKGSDMNFCFWGITKKSLKKYEFTRAIHKKI